MSPDEDRFKAWPVFKDYRIVGERIAPEGPIIRRYNALHETGLYLALLRTAGTTEGILAFVRRYGLSAARPDEDARAADEPTESRHREGDRLSDWTAAFKAARRLSRYVGLVRKGRDYETGEPLTPEDAQAAEWSFQLGITEFETRLMQRHYRLALACEWDHWQLRLIPYGLIGLIWKQLIDMLLENQRYETCKQCGELFVIQPRGPVGGSRRNRVFCSDKCRAAFGNEKKRKAKALLAQGTSVRNVANEVDVNPQTVKRWALQIQPAKKK